MTPIAPSARSHPYVKLARILFIILKRVIAMQASRKLSRIAWPTQKPRKELVAIPAKTVFIRLQMAAVNVVLKIALFAIIFKNVVAASMD